MMISARNLTKKFYVHHKAPGLWGSVRSLFSRKQTENIAVKNVSFDIEGGEIVGLVGANGAGKTTIVKMLAGIIHPSSGEAHVLGHEPWARHNDFRRQIALIMGQKAQLWWDLPAGDCFLLLREIYRVPAAEHQARLERLSKVLDVAHVMNVQIRRLSLGERMKMELIAALLHNPRVVFLDEPTIGLDLTAQRAIRDFLLEYQRTDSPAMILTSHYMEDIERLCQRIIIIRDGELVYDGSLDRVIRQYAQNKIVTVILQEGADETIAKEVASKAGEVFSASEGQVKLHVPRAEVARVAAHLIDRLPVVDLNIEEEPIGTIIENIMTRRKSQDE